MSFLIYIALLLGVVVTVEACSCPERHPQEVFCGAQFAVRAKVLSQEDYANFTRVFNLRILKTFKGEDHLRQADSVQRYGSRQRSLLAKAYTITFTKLCGVSLTNKKRYLISGRIWKGKLRLDLCHWNQEWSEITVRQRQGIRSFYGQNCNCQISPCYALRCKNLKGCGKPSGIHSDSCEWRHSYCFENADGTACSWRDTADYKNCTAKATPQGLN